MKHLSRLLALAETTREPTVASIPYILIRAVMRTTTRIILLVAGFTLAITVLLFSLALWLATWPSIHRRHIG